MAVVAALLVAALAFGRGALAQQPTPPAGANATRLLPATAALGQGWSMLPPTGIDVFADTFREAAVGYDGSPNGARVAVIALLATNSRVAVRQSWEDAGKIFDDYWYRLSSDYENEQRLGTLLPPSGCAEAKRSEGSDRQYGFPTGVTQCAADPDAIVIVVASGNVLGRSGHEASDQVATLAVKGSPGALASPTSAA